MRAINTLTGASKQHHTLLTDEGDKIDFKMYFLPRTSSWIFDLEYKALKIYGQPLVISNNLLRQFKNQVPFGLLVADDLNIDPFRQDDFLTQRCKLCILNSSDLQQLEVNVYE